MSSSFSSSVDKSSSSASANTQHVDEASSSDSLSVGNLRESGEVPQSNDVDINTSEAQDRNNARAAQIQLALAKIPSSQHDMLVTTPDLLSQSAVLIDIDRGFWITPSGDLDISTFSFQACGLTVRENLIAQIEQGAAAKDPRTRVEGPIVKANAAFKDYWENTKNTPITAEDLTSQGFKKIENLTGLPPIPAGSDLFHLAIKTESADGTPVQANCYWLSNYSPTKMLQWAYDIGGPLFTYDNAYLPPRFPFPYDPNQKVCNFPLSSGMEVKTPLPREFRLSYQQLSDLGFGPSSLSTVPTARELIDHTAANEEAKKQPGFNPNQRTAYIWDSAQDLEGNITLCQALRKANKDADLSILPAIETAGTLNAMIDRTEEVKPLSSTNLNTKIDIATLEKAGFVKVQMEAFLDQFPELKPEDELYAKALVEGDITHYAIWVAGKSCNEMLAEFKNPPIDQFVANTSLESSTLTPLMGSFNLIHLSLDEQQEDEKTASATASRMTSDDPYLSDQDDDEELLRSSTASDKSESLDPDYWQKLQHLHSIAEEITASSADTQMTGGLGAQTAYQELMFEGRSIALDSDSETEELDFTRKSASLARTTGGDVDDIDSDSDEEFQQLIITEQIERVSTPVGRAPIRIRPELMNNFFKDAEKFPNNQFLKNLLDANEHPERWEPVEVIAEKVRQKKARKAAEREAAEREITTEKTPDGAKPIPAPRSTDKPEDMRSPILFSTSGTKKPSQLPSESEASDSSDDEDSYGRDLPRRPIRDSQRTWVTTRETPSARVESAPASTAPESTTTGGAPLYSTYGLDADPPAYTNTRTGESQSAEQLRSRRDADDPGSDSDAELATASQKSIFKSPSFKETETSVEMPPSTVPSGTALEEKPLEQQTKTTTATEEKQLDKSDKAQKARKKKTKRHVVESEAGPSKSEIKELISKRSLKATIPSLAALAQPKFGALTPEEIESLKSEKLYFSVQNQQAAQQLIDTTGSKPLSEAERKENLNAFLADLDSDEE